MRFFDKNAILKRNCVKAAFQRGEKLMKKIEKVGLIGLGAMGAYFVPGLSDGLGKDLRIIAGGERARRLRENGVYINGRKFDLNIIDPNDRPEPSDLIIIAVKNYALDKALHDIRNQVGPDTLIMSVLNGVDSEEHVARAYGSEHVIYSLMRISIEMKDGRADFDPQKGYLCFGDIKNDPTALSENVSAIKELFDRCGIGYRIKPDMRYEIWLKFMGNVGENMTCALLGTDFGMLAKSPDAQSICKSAMLEVVELARAQGIGLSKEHADIQLQRLPALPKHNRPSTLQDLERGRPTEVDTFSGTVVRMGRELGIPTPVNEVLLHGIYTLEQKEALSK